MATKQALYAELSKKVEAAKAALQEAQAFADEHALEFHFGTDHWRMSGTYYGKGFPASWNSSTYQCEGYDESGSEPLDAGEWRTSSDDC